MKKSVIARLVATTTAFLGSATLSFAQYGACEPACAVPAVEACAPTCDTSYAPTCAPTCAPSCDVPCPPSCGNYGGVGCGNAYGGLFAIVDDVARVATAPFQWIACAFTDGIYPDCGCAPRPPKTPCNPCNICGDYVGGCNDAGGCAPCAGGYAGGYAGGQFSYAAAQNAYPVQNYAAPQSQYYDVESYDSSPTRFSANTRPVQNGGFSSALGEVLGTRRPANPQPNMYANVQPTPVVAPQSGVRPASYDQRVVESQVVRHVAAPSIDAQTARMNSELQNKQNVRIVASVPEANAATGAKSFGVTRPVK